VIFYDQLGCGRSDQPEDPGLWRIERFVEEIQAVRDGLGLSSVHLLGHSWGGWLAIEYMLSRPAAVMSLVLSGASGSVDEYLRGTEQLRTALPAGLRETLLRYEAAADFHNPEYEAAVLQFYKQHFCRLDPWPDPLMRTVQNITGNPVYQVMWGPNEFIGTGNLVGWDQTRGLAKITAPTLITVGRYDSATLSCAETLHRSIPGSRLEVLESSSHMAPLEEPNRYIDLVRQFLVEVERNLVTA
jgi:proline-specific peptidase